MTEHYANHIIPSFFYLLVSIRVLLTSMAALGTISHNFILFYLFMYIEENINIDIKQGRGKLGK